MDKKVNLIKFFGRILFSIFASLSGTNDYTYENGKIDLDPKTHEIKSNILRHYQQKKHLKNLIQRNQMLRLYQIQDLQIKLGVCRNLSTNFLWIERYGFGNRFTK